MKKNAQYEINFATNTIVVTRRFQQAASTMGTPEFTAMMELRKLGMPIAVRSVKSDSRETKWSYARMEQFIRSLAGSEKYMADYQVIRSAYPYMTVWKWFKQQFPRYAEVPELDENHKIVVLPQEDIVGNDTIKRIA